MVCTVSQEGKSTYLLNLTTHCTQAKLKFTDLFLFVSYLAVYNGASTGHLLLIILMSISYRFIMSQLQC